MGSEPMAAMLVVGGRGGVGAVVADDNICPASLIPDYWSLRLIGGCSYDRLVEGEGPRRRCVDDTVLKLASGTSEQENTSCRMGEISSLSSYPLQSQWFSTNRSPC